MKKLFITLMLGFLLLPSQLFATTYKLDELTSLPGIPIKTPILYSVAVSLGYNTGDLYVSPNFNTTNLHITVTANGFTYLNVTTSLTSGQVYADSLAFLDEGIYLMTISIGNIVFSQYEVTVEE